MWIIVHKRRINLQVKVKNWDINYEVLGEGKPVVLLHGWLTDLETMRPIANNLKDSFKVYLIDVIGFGKSSLPEHALTTNDFGDFLKEFVQKLEIKIQDVAQGLAESLFV